MENFLCNIRFEPKLILQDYSGNEYKREKYVASKQPSNPWDFSGSRGVFTVKYIISYDLGTGGLKAGLYQTDGASVGFEFYPYETYYLEADWHEQHPQDWWQAVCVSTQKLLQSNSVDPKNVMAVAASGHSLVAAPIGVQGELLLESVPIWSDRRAKEEAAEFFRQVDYEKWYLSTGNGDPAETYSVFKLMWLKKHQPEIFAKTITVLGSKDYINFRLTGQIATDYSYASGSGVFELENWSYSDVFIEAAGLPRSFFVQPTESHALVGLVTQEAAEMCGLRAGTKVMCGGVDNACMALGTTGIGIGRVYTSLGSSAWIAVSAEKPILDAKKLPFIFAHVEKGFYTSGVSIFSAGNAYRWAKDTFCAELNDEPYVQMNALAATSPVGANGIMFNPSLSGGSSQEPSQALQGAFFGLKLSNNRADMLRAILEGVAFSLNGCLAVIEPMLDVNDTMIICGGGAKSDLWMQIFADIYNKKIIVTNVDQDAASLGAAAIAARGAGFWQDYTPLDQLYQVLKTFYPMTENRDRYMKIANWYSQWINTLAIIHDRMKDEK
jgi:xylulokinase